VFLVRICLCCHLSSILKKSEKMKMTTVQELYFQTCISSWKKRFNMYICTYAYSWNKIDFLWKKRIHSRNLRWVYACRRILLRNCTLSYNVLPRKDLPTPFSRNIESGFLFVYSILIISVSLWGQASKIRNTQNLVYTNTLTFYKRV